MAPTATQTETITQTPMLLQTPNKMVAAPSSTDYYIPLQLSGALKRFEKNDLTPLIGTRFEAINLTEILHSPVCDQTIRDIAITISQRGVCIFPKQEHLTIEDQKLLARKLGELTCRPHTSGLHIHPLNQTTMPDGTIDAELTTLARDPTKKLHKNQSGFSGGAKVKKQSHVDGWHTDSDTLFASAYEVYDLLSEPYAKLLEALTATFMPPDHQPAEIEDRMWKGPRGSPENIGADLRAVHRCIRTNPVTGWKYVYAMGHHMQGIDRLADVESKMVKEHMERLVTDNQQLQLRVKWQPEDLAIWDNRAVYHCATYDYNAKRVGNRICGVGEKPYLDPRSSGRRKFQYIKRFTQRERRNPKQNDAKDSDGWFSDSVRFSRNHLIVFVYTARTRREHQNLKYWLSEREDCIRRDPESNK
ncbi:MAG: hypothetical protein ALECFALPRED_006146 [Alectoria fallacina]|uniref:TauD/TfdA-like domain-containing protein n=1 Tax=Alectoria fallacina TaxID=1903189 RepID=A0A8H3ENU9_9LECA|nr:MAG: hypothetical protein ALECFALPRED_006146 [Alectoria fallacina]